jgi:hypothetical protein
MYNYFFLSLLINVKYMLISFRHIFSSCYINYEYRTYTIKADTYGAEKPTCGVGNPTSSFIQSGNDDKLQVNICHVCHMIISNK